MVDWHLPWHDDDGMRCTLLFVALLLIPRAAAAQVQGTLHITVMLPDGQQALAPVPRHALLISDNPATAAPRRVVTGPDGAVDVRLQPGNYTVESDLPAIVAGQSFEWTVDVDVTAGNSTALLLNAANAAIAAVADSGTQEAGAGTRHSDPSMALQAWTPSVVALWTETTRASGFAFDRRGLIATSAQALAGATMVEAQVTPTVKVAGRVIATDAGRDVAIVQVAAAAVSALRALAPSCAELPKAPVEGDELFALGAPLRAQQDRLSSGGVKRVSSTRIEADLRIPAGGVGGPVFSEASELVGLSSLLDDAENGRRAFAVVLVQRLCESLASAEEAMRTSSPPAALHLPVEPTTPVPVASLKELAARRAGDLEPYQLSSSDFDVAFITPVMVYGLQNPPADRHTTSKDTHRPLEEELRVSHQAEFGNWAEYVGDNPPVLLVRVTPKLTESFWKTVARGAAMTQGIQLPAMKQAKARLSRMRAFCGEAEVPAVHAFTIETPVSETESFDEGLYVFTPDALGPACGSVKLVLFSEKEPQKGDSRTVDAAVLARLQQDFALLNAH